MELQYKELGHDSYAYVYEKDGENLGEITWALSNDVMVMNHTFVNPKLRGTGLAKELLDQSAEFAREKNYKMKPLCSYVVNAFNDSSEYDDVKA